MLPLAAEAHTGQWSVAVTLGGCGAVGVADWLSAELPGEETGSNSNPAPAIERQKPGPSFKEGAFFHHIHTKPIP
jgi:hypothetical protein